MFNIASIQENCRRFGPARQLALAGILGALVSACGMIPAKDHKPEPVVARVLPPPTPRTEGAIYQAGQQMELFADLKARRVGDVLTIVLNESTNASKNAITKTAKTTTVANSAPTLFGQSMTIKGAPILSATLNGADSFDGEGSSTQSNSLAGSLTVTVVDVQANGNLVVQGDKTLSSIRATSSCTSPASSARQTLPPTTPSPPTSWPMRKSATRARESWTVPIAWDGWRGSSIRPFPHSEAGPYTCSSDYS